MAVQTEWTGDGRPDWVPRWIPSADAIQKASVASIDNVKANLTQEGKSNKDKAIEVALLLVQYVCLLMVLIGLGPATPPWFLAQIAGFALVIVGAFFTTTAMASLATKLSLLPTPNDDSDLITIGVFSHCRHPMYFGMLTFGMGFSMLTLSCSRIIYTIIMWAALEKKADIEELHLVEKFPGSYMDYMSKVPKFIPGRLVAVGADNFYPLDDEEAANIGTEKIAE